MTNFSLTTKDARFLKELGIAVDVSEVRTGYRRTFPKPEPAEPASAPEPAPLHDWLVTGTQPTVHEFAKRVVEIFERFNDEEREEIRRLVSEKIAGRNRDAE